MAHDFVSELYRTFSQERLESYRGRSGSNFDMVTNYFWDVELAKTLVPLLHAVELALRNSIHAAMARHYNSELWFYERDLLEPRQLK